MKRKVCKQCGIEQSIRCFYRDWRYPGGRLSICKTCKRANVAENLELKFEYYRARKRIWAARPENKEKRRAYARTERGRQVHAAGNRRWRRMRRLTEHRA